MGAKFVDEPIMIHKNKVSGSNLGDEPDTSLPLLRASGGHRRLVIVAWDNEGTEIPRTFDDHLNG